jgi:hypothetical protein
MGLRAFWYTLAVKSVRAIHELVDSVARDLGARLAEGVVPRGDRTEARRMMMEAWSIVSAKGREAGPVSRLLELVRRMDAVVARCGSPVSRKPFVPASLRFPWPIRVRTVSDGPLPRAIERFERATGILARRIDFMVEHAMQAAGRSPKPGRAADPSAPPPGAGGGIEHELVWGETEGR